jgi:hypothetical protein
VDEAVDDGARDAAVEGAADASARAGFGTGLLLCSDIDFKRILVRKSRSEL